VIRSRGVDPTATHAVSHQFGEVCPQRSPLISAQIAARQQRIQLMAEPQLCAVDVADSDQY
jgi:hypothetical protein